MSKYREIRMVIMEILQDGEIHSPNEIYDICVKNGIKVCEDKSDLYNVVHRLKKKEKIVAYKAEGYMLMENFERMKTTEGFDIVMPANRKKKKQRITVFNNGEISISESLREVLKTNKVEIHLKKDRSQIILVPNGEFYFKINKNNRIKNCAVYEKFENEQVKFPIYYIGKWNDEEKIWKGDLVLEEEIHT